MLQDIGLWQRTGFELHSKPGRCKPRHESVKNGAGVACIPKIRAALRLKAFEARPDANCGPSDGSKVRKNGVVGNDNRRRPDTDSADHGSLVQER